MTSQPSKLVLPPLIKHVVFSREQIAVRVQELGQQITTDYAGNELVVFGVLKGVLFFLADLLRAIDLPVRSDLMAIAGYRAGEKRPSGTVRIIKDLDLDVYQRHVLIIEDMVDTGLTLNFILKIIKARQPASLAVCALLNREGHRLAPNLPLKYIGFDAPSDFLVGYGLDFLDQYRALPYIGALKPEVYAF
jgi:hypoxanthine phosphoribosyltransferase